MKAMIKLGQFVLGAALLCWSCQDADSPEPGDTFLKYYGRQGAQVGAGIVYLEETGESIIYGTQLLADVGNSNLFLLKVDENGNEVISIDIDLTDVEGHESPELYNDLVGSVRLHGSNLYYIGTSLNAEIREIAWAIFDLDLNLVNQGWISSGNGNLTGKDLVVDDGELVLIGTADFVLTPGDPLEPNGGEEQQIYLARVNPSDPDSVLVQRTRGFQGIDDVIYADHFADDNIVIVGTTSRTVGSQGTNLLVMALNDILIPRGSEEITVTIGGENNFNEVALGVYKRPGGYVITGGSTRGTSAYPFFVNVSYNASGTISVDQVDTLGVEQSQGNNGTGHGITLSPTGNYFIVGTMPTASKSAEIMVLQADQAGSSLTGLERSYGLSSGNDVGNDVVVSNDGSLLILSTVDFGGANTLLSLMKVNGQGDLMR